MVSIGKKRYWTTRKKKYKNVSKKKVVLKKNIIYNMYSTRILFSQNRHQDFKLLVTPIVVEIRFFLILQKQYFTLLYVLVCKSNTCLSWYLCYFFGRSFLLNCSLSITIALPLFLLFIALKGNSNKQKYIYYYRFQEQKS